MWCKDVKGNWFLASDLIMKAEKYKDNQWNKDEEGNWYVEKSHVLHVEVHG